MVSDSSIAFELTDGRSVSVPLSWSWRLEGATEEERQNFQISPSGHSVHWPDVDEDLSAHGALRGTPAPRPSTAPPAETPSEWMPGRIQKLRNQLGMSQAAFAERMGVRQGNHFRLGNGKTGAFTNGPTPSGSNCERSRR
ncbi:DUF2442 domain-containing protein [Salinibacter ruber]|uniref:DUF2442 domain-containing protein n=1 Tax=Salinibacter ruber TaxID=146919 RepID=UPI003C6E140D